MSHKREMEDHRFRTSVIESTIIRRENLEEMLYHDAGRRRKDQEKAKADLDRVRDTPQGKPYHNDKSDKYVQQRFERELKVAKEELLQTLQANKGEAVPGNVVEEVRLNFHDMFTLITRMGFLPKSKAPENFEVALC